MSPAQLQERAQEAKHITENPLFKEAFSLFEQEIFKAWQSTSADNEKDGSERFKREEMWRLMKSAQRFKAVFESYIVEGENAAALAIHEEVQKRRFGTFFR